ncbi:MAG: hypothetical protein CMJ59_15765 [Planctomycetaceae bacterium]|nr:hypothetical protein [Planctomycetaceae bacterium]
MPRSFLAALVLCCPAGLLAAEPPADAPFSPTGLVLWLDAADAKVLEGKVAEWPDRSGRGNNVLQSNADLRPTKVDVQGLPAIRFANAKLERDRLVGFLSGEQTFQVFLVMQASLQQSGSPRMLDLASLGGADNYSNKRKGFWVGYEDYSLDPNAKGHLRVGVSVGAEGAADRLAWDAKRHLVEAVYAGNQRWALYQDGTAVGHGRYRGDVGFLGFDRGSKLALGHYHGKQEPEHFYQGDLFEVLIFDHALAAREQQQLGQYLDTKYNLKSAYSEPPTQALVFEEHIQPLLARQCFDCHAGDEPQSGLNLTEIMGLFRGGTSGPAIVPGSAQQSILMHITGAKEMPPKEGGEPLSNQDIELIRRWIDSGAKARQPVDLAALANEHKSDHWAFQRLRLPAVPESGQGDTTGNPIDRFVLRKLKPKQLSLSPPADRTTLIRRAALDLTGILPTPQEVTAFTNDDAPTAWQTLLDRLLNSPHFGERWARHWLDGAGYSDTVAIDNDQVIVKPAKGKWKYRDYVVRSLNEDRPYDQFLTEQLAGDELVDWRTAPRFDDNIREKLVATGLLRCSPDDTDQGELNIFSIRYFVLHRTAESLAQNLLGLTMQCCKCHDHKFEPISQRDYYRFTAFITPALQPRDWLQPQHREMRMLGKAELAELTQQRDQQRGELASLREVGRKRLYDQALAAVPEPLREDLLAAQKVAKEKRDEIQKYLTDKLGEKFEFKPAQITDALSEPQRQHESELVRGVAALDRQEQESWVQAVYDVGSRRPTFVLRRGEFEMPGAEVRAGLFRALEDPDFPAPDTAPQGSTSGRRLRLAKQLTNWKSPAGALVARVRVNRIWQRLFEVGIVQTPSNFGRSGVPPTHPELLEWLTSSFVATGGKLKPLLKRIMTSQTYRQQSFSDDSEAANRARRADPGNQLLWRQRLRRLEAEIVRDSMLVASGRLDPKLGGPPSPTLNRPDGMVVEVGYDKVTETTTWRRSMYLLQRRNYHPSVLQAFDQPLLTENCTKRDASASIAQSLMMLNDQFVGDQAAALARRVIGQSKDKQDAAAQISRAFQLTLVRGANDEELQWLLDAFNDHKRAYANSGQDPAASHQAAMTRLCQAFFSTSEFLYVH